jgi:hypothetical protein
MKRVCRGPKEPETYQTEEVLSSAHVTPKILDALLKLDEYELGTLLFRGFEELRWYEEWSMEPYTLNEATGRLGDSLQGYQIFLDDTGRLGIAPEGARKGDSVCVFDNSVEEAACLLRPRSKSGWTLVSGDCYLQGIGMWNDIDHSTLPLRKGNSKVEFDIW